MKSPALCAGRGRSSNLISLRDFFRLVLDVFLLDAGYHGAELLGGLEDRNRTGRDLDGRARPRISCHARLAMTDLEGAEAANFDVLLILQRFLDRLEECVDDPGAILLGNHRTRGPGDLLSDSLDQVCFGHEYASCSGAKGRGRLPNLAPLTLMCQEFEPLPAVSFRTTSRN